MAISRAQRALAGASLLAAAACAAPEAEPTGFAVRDSAGVEIVENRGPGPHRASAWAVGATPALRIGAREGAPAEQFTDLGGATRLSDGRIVVLENSVSEVRFFAPDGTPLLTRGGLGDGPGEFRYARALTRGPADSVYVHDIGSRGLTVFTPAGEFAHRDVPDFAELAGRYERNRSCLSNLPILADGSFFGCAVAPELPTREGRPETGLVPRAGFRIVRLHRDTARADMLGLWLGPLPFYIVEGDFLTGRSHAFFPTSHFAAGRDPLRFYLARNPAYDIEVWEPDGRLLRRVRRLDARLTPTEEESSEATDRLVASMTGDNAEPFMNDAMVERILTDFPVPDSVPAVHSLTGGPAGELWVKRGPILPSTTTSRFDVFDGDGVFIGQVTLGLPVELLEVGADYILAAHEDELEVPYVLMYDLDRSGG